jgi:hypothetical protein
MIGCSGSQKKELRVNGVSDWEVEEKVCCDLIAWF